MNDLYISDLIYEWKINPPTHSESSLLCFIYVFLIHFTLLILLDLLFYVDVFVDLMICMI